MQRLDIVPPYQCTVCGVASNHQNTRINDSYKASATVYANDANHHVPKTNCAPNDNDAYANYAPNMDDDCAVGQKIDLHSHSTASDGTHAPGKVVSLAHEAGVKVLALTDHDTINGIAEAKLWAKRVGICLINGVEISCKHVVSGGFGKNTHIVKTIHIVGLDFCDTDKMQQALAQHQTARAKRARIIATKLAPIVLSAVQNTPNALDAKFLKQYQVRCQAHHAQNASSISTSVHTDTYANTGANASHHINDMIDILWQHFLAAASGNAKAIGRAHIGQVLFTIGLVPTVQAAFDKYLSEKKPAYAPLEVMNMQDTIALIHDCGGVAVLAHPTRYKLSSTRTAALIADFARAGGDACELAQNAPKSLNDMLARHIKKHHLCVSLGSDFHGDNMPWRKIGHVPYLDDNQIGIWRKFKYHLS